MTRKRSFLKKVLLGTTICVSLLLSLAICKNSAMLPRPQKISAASEANLEQSLQAADGSGYRSFKGVVTQISGDSVMIDNTGDAITDFFTTNEHRFPVSIGDSAFGKNIYWVPPSPWILEKVIHHPQRSL